MSNTIKIYSTFGDINRSAKWQLRVCGAQHKFVIDSSKKCYSNGSLNSRFAKEYKIENFVDNRK